MKEATTLSQSFINLVEVVHELREKCPWDKKQTFESLRHLSIEETYELAETILTKDYNEMKLELGDLLLHIVFYATIAAEQGHFDLKQVIQSQTEKLIRRHPHIYGEVSAETEEQVLKNWEQIKAQEKLQKAESSQPQSRLAGVPRSLPSLVQAYRIQQKVAGVGFDWENSSQVIDKIQEEIQEFETATDQDDKTAEMGDLLFSLVNYCRFKGINPDDALAQTNLKFKKRFMYMEKKAFEKGIDLTELTIEEMEKLWKDAKQNS